MLIYIEKQAKDYYQTKKILEKFKNAKVVLIDNYKNIFDKDYYNLNYKKSIIIAKLYSNPLTKTPIGYGHNDNSYFLKTSLNCIFDCKYCYLKGAFKNENIVIFVNYEDIKENIKLKIKNGKNDKPIWFYSGDYSDIIGLNVFSSFVEEFIPFFEKLNKDFYLKEKINNNKNNFLDRYAFMLEIRTKSANISPFLNLGFIPKSTEISYSLNPQNLIEKYETGTSNLDDRIKVINILLERGFKVGLRFLPLLPVKNYKKIYTEFIIYLKENIDMKKIYSTFASGLLYTRKDYNKMLLKYKDLDILYMLELDDDGFYREARKVRNYFYKIFKELDKNCLLCLDK